MRPLATVCLLLVTSSLLAKAQVVPPDKADEARIDGLLKQMTLEEKMNLIRGDVEPAATNQGQAGYLPGVPRLGIPPLRMADGPPGVLTRVAGQEKWAAFLALDGLLSRIGKDADQRMALQTSFPATCAVG